MGVTWWLLHSGQWLLWPPCEDFPLDSSSNCRRVGSGGTELCRSLTHFPAPWSWWAVLFPLCTKSATLYDPWTCHPKGAWVDGRASSSQLASDEGYSVTYLHHYTCLPSPSRSGYGIFTAIVLMYKPEIELLYKLRLLQELLVYLPFSFLPCLCMSLVHAPPTDHTWSLVCVWSVTCWHSASTVLLATGLGLDSENGLVRF